MADTETTYIIAVRFAAERFVVTHSLSSDARTTTAFSRDRIFFYEGLDDCLMPFSHYKHEGYRLPIAVEVKGNLGTKVYI